MLSLEAVANNVREVINRFAIPQLVDLNFDGVTEYPTLEFAGVSRVDVEKLATAYQTLTSAGGVLADPEDETLSPSP